MCGICCVFSLSSPYKHGKALMDATSHRGLNDSGYYLDTQRFIGMHRLQIRGRKTNLPVVNGEDIFAFNGQIYRNKNLAPIQSINNEIECSLSHTTAPDGMYAVVKLSQNKISAKTDPLQIKPLFLKNETDCVMLCSEISALVCKNTHYDRKALTELYQFGWPISNSTCYENIHQISEAEINLEPNNIKLSFKEDLRIRELNQTSANYDLRTLIQKSVAQCIKGDGEMGLALSGGVDSKILAYELNDMGVTDLQTFSVVLSESDDGIKSLEELGLPENGAWKTWTHTFCELDNNDFHHRFQSSSIAFAQPTTMSSLPLYDALAELVATTNVKYILVGEGVDEIFYGYSSYQKLQEMPDRFEYYFFERREQLLQKLFSAEELGQARKTFTQKFNKCNDIRICEMQIRLRRLLLRTDLAFMRRTIEARTPFLHGGIVEYALSHNMEDLIADGGKSVLRRAYSDRIPGINKLKKRRFKATHTQLFTSIYDIAGVDAISNSLDSVFGKSRVQNVLHAMRDDEIFDEDIASLILSHYFIETQRS